MKNNTPHTLQDCFAIIDSALTPDDKQAVARAHEFELRYAFHGILAQWVRVNLVDRYGLQGEDFFYSHDLWQQILIVDSPDELSTLILLAYRRYLLNN
ncbi:MAG: hypothetical protein KBT13_09510 [Bacteroidales bacterium]|nr:hypothetical protein [Candidatus Sodaliphilus limicaballi]